MFLRSRSSPRLHNNISNSESNSPPATMKYLEEIVNAPLSPSRSNGKWKIWHLLLIVLILGIVIYIKLFDSFRVEEIPNSPPDPSKRQLTVVMNTFKRYELMMDAIDHYSKCNVVRYIHIVWSEKDAPSHHILNKYAKQPGVLPSVSTSLRSSSPFYAFFSFFVPPHVGLFRYT
jgi:hypothetical protein